MTAPTIATATTPPAAMLSKKFLREGVTAASATSGTTMEAVNAAAVKPVTTFSFKDALTSNLPLGLDTATPFEARRANGALNDASDVGTTLFWVA